MKTWTKVLLAALLMGGRTLYGQAANTAQQLAFAGLRAVAAQGQINGVKTDPSGNLYLLLDQKDGVRVLKTDSTASTLLAQTLLGAKGDVGGALALDPAGNVYVTGTTTSAALNATAGAAISTRTDSSTQSFVAKFDGSLNPVFVTFTGGSRIAATALAATSDAVFVTGLTYGSNLPVTSNGIQQSPAYGSSQNGFVERFSTSGATLTYATYLTGASGDTTPAAIAADSSDNAYIAGFTSASGYPTVAALVPTILSNPSGFLTKLTPAGDAITFSTFIPGAGLTSLALDSTGSTLLASGSVALGQFPVDTVAEPLVPLNYQVLLRLPLDGSGVQSSVLIAPGSQSQLAPAADGSVWLNGVLSYPQLALPALADEGSGFALRVTPQGAIDQTARFGGLPTTNPGFASQPLTLGALAVDPAGEPLIAGAVQPTASSSLLATETYDLPLRSTGVFSSTLKNAEVTAATCQGSLCAGSAAYLAKLTPANGAALVLAGDDLPFVTVRNLGTATATGVQFVATTGTVGTDCATTLAAGASCSLLLSGGGAGTLTASAANSAAVTLVYPAYAAPASSIAFHPKELDFGIVSSTGRPTTQTVTISNLGSASQNFASTNNSASSGWSEASSDCTTSGTVTTKILGAGGTCHITLAFTAASASTSDGPLTGNWTIGARSLALSAYSQAAALSVSAAEVDFGTQFLNGLKLPRYLYLSNNSTQSFSHAAVTLPASTSFTVTDGCPATLLPATVCRIRIDYADAKAPATDSATIVLDQGLTALLTGQTLPPPTVTGTTVNPNLAVTPASITFANAVPVTSVSAVTQNVGISNTGATPFALTLALTGDFAQTTSCPATLAGGQTCAVAITFVPGQPGTRSGLLAVTAGAGTSPAYVTLTGTGTAILAANNGALASGSVPVGQPTTTFYQIAVPFSSFTATATGPYTLAIVANNGTSPVAPLPSAFATTVSAACPNCYLAVRFQPTAAGPQPGTLTLTSVTAGTPYSLALTGTGLAVNGLLLTPATQDFGAVAIHSSSGSVVFTLTNAVATGTAVALTGPAFTGDFAQASAIPGSTACTGTLAYGASCQFAASFVPTAAGTRTGSVAFTSGTLAASAGLTGTGTPDPGLSINPTSLTFSNVPGTSSTSQQVRITNTGTTTLAVGTPSTASAAFTVSNSSCAALTPGTSCTVTVAYIPGSAIAADTLSLPVISSGVQTTYTVALAGTYTSANAGIEVVPALSTFGPANVGAPGATRLITVNNLTSKTLAVNVDLPRQYMLTGTPCIALMAGGSCTLSVVFMPLTNGEAAGTLYAQANPSDGSATLTGIGYLEGFGAGSASLALGNALIANGVYNFGQVASGQTAAQTFSVTNQGAAPLTVRRVTSTPPFLSTSTCGTALATTQNCTVTVTYTPSNQVAAGTTSPGATSDAGTLTIESDSASSPDVVTLTGQAGAVTVSSPSNTVPLATYTLSQNSLTFPSTAVGNTSTAQAVTLTNTGSVALHVLNIFSTSDFSASSNCAVVLPGAACTLNVAENPQTTGNHLASLEILSDSSTSLEYLSLFGVGTAAPLTLAPSALDFGSVNVGTSSRLAVQVSNTSAAPVTFTGISASGDYSAAGSCPAPGMALAAGASCTVQVTFAPAATGTRTGTLSVASSASTNPLTVPLTGIGLQSHLVVTPSSLAFGSVVGGVPANLTLTLVNTGTAAITGLALTTAGDYSVSIPCAATTLAPGASCSVQVTFTPAAVGARPGTLTVVSSDPTSPLAVPLTGTGIQSGSFLLTVNGGASASAFVASGRPATYNLTVTPTGGFSGNVALTCAAITGGQFASCSITPSALTLAGAPLTAVATINTITSIAALDRAPLDRSPFSASRLLVCLLLPAAILVRRRRLPALFLLLYSLAILGCGSTSGDPNARYTPTGTYQYAVTASSTSGVQVTQTVTLNLTVTPR